MNGETIITKDECIVTKVSIDSYSRPVFTDGFLNGIRALQTAAENPEVDSSKRTRINFIEEYGTHYQSECFLGASMSTISRMSSKSINEAERSRRKECISRSFQESKSKGAETVEVDVEVSANCVGSAGTKIGGWGIGNSKAFSESSSQCENYAGSQSAFASAGVRLFHSVSCPMRTKKIGWMLC